MKYDKPYQPPVVTVDVVIFNTINNILHVLVSKRAKDPFKNQWSLPGGYSPADKMLIDSLQEISLRKAGIDIKKLQYLEQFYAFDSIDRDPRGHAISIAYFGCGHNLELEKANQESKFIPINDLPKLAYDHQEIIKLALQKIANQLDHSNISSSLLPKTFTLSQLQTLYEQILNQELDKRNFRKKILKSDLLEETGELKKDGAHRPAKTYYFKS